MGTPTPFGATPERNSVKKKQLCSVLELIDIYQFKKKKKIIRFPSILK